MIKNQGYCEYLKEIKKSFANFVVIPRDKIKNIPVRIQDRCLLIQRQDSEYITLAVNDDEFYELMDVL